MGEYRDLVKKGCEFRYGEVEDNHVGIDLLHGKIIKGLVSTGCHHSKRSKDYCSSDCPALKKDNPIKLTPDGDPLETPQ